MAKVLAAIDGSEHAMYALEQAVGMFGDSAEYILLSVVPPWSGAGGASLSESGLLTHGTSTGSSPYTPRADDAAVATDALYDYYRTAQRQAATRAGVEADHVIEEAKPNKRRIGRAVCDSAHDKGADVILIGSHGSSHAGEFLLGSVTQYVLHHATCPVLVVRPPL